jgi:large subunit ribosomal protein L23
MSEHRLMKIILAPIVSEKSARGADLHHQYTFRVLRDAKKPEIKAAVEKMFEVKVDSVTTSNVRGKIKRFGSSTGKRSDWKKATVRLQDGQEIDFVGAE